MADGLGVSLFGVVRLVDLSVGCCGCCCFDGCCGYYRRPADKMADNWPERRGRTIPRGLSRRTHPHDSKKKKKEATF